MFAPASTKFYSIVSSDMRSLKFIVFHSAKSLPPVVAISRWCREFSENDHRSVAKNTCVLYGRDVGKLTLAPGVSTRSEIATDSTAQSGMQV